MLQHPGNAWAATPRCTPGAPESIRGLALQGTLPTDWAMKKAVPALKALNLSGNYELSGPLPDAWSNASAGMQSLQVFSARGCNLSGPLPASWAGLPALGVLDMAYNYFTGDELSLASRIVCMLKLCSAALLNRQLGRHASVTWSPACWRPNVLPRVCLFCHNPPQCVALWGRFHSPTALSHLGAILCPPLMKQSLMPQYLPL